MQQNRTKNTGRVEAPTQERAAENPKYQPHGTTRTTQPEREKKKGKQKLKEKEKKAQGSKGKHGNKEGREEEKTRGPRPAQGRSEN